MRRSRPSYGALSCDHLEYLSDAGVQAMARAGTVAVLLPGAFYFLRETKLPPLAALRAAGVPIAIASDHNPGSSPGLSLLLMINMACTLFRLTPEEALRGVTVHGARALGLADRGTLAAGQRADFAVWDLEHPNELAYWFGQQPVPCASSSAARSAWDEAQPRIDREVSMARTCRWYNDGSRPKADSEGRSLAGLHRREQSRARVPGSVQGILSSLLPRGEAPPLPRLCRWRRLFAMPQEPPAQPGVGSST